jgi:adenosylmethionine-8-amino-7-oxononanoate aminotransferase
VLGVLQDRKLVAAAAERGEQLANELHANLQGHPHVGDIRGLGLLRGIELVEHGDTPYDRKDRVAERVVRRAKELGLLLYHSTGCADGTNGDLILLGPPLVITPAEVTELSDLLATALHDVVD